MRTENTQEEGIAGLQKTFQPSSDVQSQFVGLKRKMVDGEENQAFANYKKKNP